MDASVNQILVNTLLTVAAAATPIIAGYAVQALRAFAKKKGIEVNDAQLARVDTFLVNGLNAANATLKGATSLPAGTNVKTYMMNSAIDYLKAHGKETLDGIGADLSSPRTMDSLRARMETLINQPDAPTPPALDKAAPTLDDVKSAVVVKDPPVVVVPEPAGSRTGGAQGFSGGAGPAR